MQTPEIDEADIAFKIETLLPEISEARRQQVTDYIIKQLKEIQTCPATQ